MIDKLKEERREERGEDSIISFSTVFVQHHMDNGIGVHIIDRWTYYALEFLEKVRPGSKATLQDFVS